MLQWERTYSVTRLQRDPHGSERCLCRRVCASRRKRHCLGWKRRGVTAHTFKSVLIVLTVTAVAMSSLTPLPNGRMTSLDGVTAVAAEPGRLDHHFIGESRVLRLAGSGRVYGINEPCYISATEICTPWYIYYETGRLFVVAYDWSDDGADRLIFEPDKPFTANPLTPEEYQKFQQVNKTCDARGRFCYRWEQVGNLQNLVRARSDTGEARIVYSATGGTGVFSLQTLTVDGTGNAHFVRTRADGDEVIVRVNLAAEATTIAGGDAVRSRAYGTPATKYDFYNVGQMAFDAAGNLFVTEAAHGLVMQVTGLGDMAPPVPDEQSFGWCDDVGGAAVNPTTCRSDPINTATGSFTDRNLDVQLGGSASRFRFERSYNSKDSAVGPMGRGWSMSYDDRLSFPDATTAVLRTSTGQQLVFRRDGTNEWVPAAGGGSDLRKSGSTHTVTLRDGHVYTFDTSGRLTALADRNGKGVQFGRDGSGRLSTATDDADRTVTFTFDTANHLTEVRLPDGRAVTYEYQGGLLWKVHALGGGVVTYGYDSASRVASIIDANNETKIQNVYDINGRVTSQTDAMNATSHFDWRPDTETSVLTDAAGGTWVDDYDNNVLKRSVDPVGNLTTFTYDRDLNLIATSRGSTTPPPPVVEEDFVEWLLSLQLLASAPPPAGDRTTYMTYDRRGNLQSRVAPEPLNYTEGWTYDVGDRPLTYTNGRGKTTSFGYDLKGNLVSERKPGLPAMVYVRDGDGRVTDMITPRGHTTTLGYDVAGNLRSSTNPLGDVTTWSYDSAGRMRTRTAAAGNEPGAVPASHRWAWTYTADDRLATETTPLGHVTTRHYDPVGNVADVEHPDGGVTRYGYNAADQLTSETDPDGDATTTLYDDRGLLIRTTSAEGRTTSWSYDLARRVASMVEPRGNASPPSAGTWTYEHDIYGKVVTVRDPIGATTTSSYDELDRLVARTDPLDRTARYSYDASGNATSTTDAGGAVTTHAYDPAGRRITTTNPLGHTVVYTYDDNGNPLTDTSSLGLKTSRTYDALDRIAAIVSPAGNVAGADASSHRTVFAYDPDGNLKELAEPVAATTTLSHDALGRLTTATDPGGSTTQYRYDPNGRIERVIDGLNHATTWSYDLDGDMTSRTDANTHTTTWTYDRDALPVSAILPGTQAWAYRYDANSNLVRSDQPNAKSTAYSYDARDRLTSLNYSDTTPDVSYTYDAAGQTTAVDDGTGHRDFTYDAVGRVTGEKHDETDALGYTYDAAGQVKQRSYPGGITVGYGYDADGRLVTVTPTVGGATTYEFDANSNVTKTKFPNSFVDLRTYDAAGRVDTITHRRGAVALNEIDYTRDAGGRPLRIGQTGGVERYTYDVLGQLSGVCYAEPCAAASAQIHYSYDSVGNRVQETRPDRTTNYSYDVNDRLVESTTGATTTTADHDPNGNLTRLGATSYTYDAADRLSSATTAATAQVFSYNASGDRSRTATTDRTTGATVATFGRWDHSLAVPQLAAEGPTANSLTRTHVYGHGRIETLDATTPTYYLTDALGTVTTATDANHTLWRDYRYEPFGAIRSSTGSVVALGSQFGLAGEQLDQKTNLYNLRARNLDPNTGRFLSSDPLPAAHGTPDRSDYLYANNRPTLFTDPTGWRESEDEAFFKCGAAFYAAYWDVFTFGLAGKVINGTANLFGKDPADATFCGSVGSVSGAAGGAVLAGAAVRGAVGSRLPSVSAPQALRLADGGVVNPSSIRFTQNSVSPNFSARGSIDDLASGLRSGALDPGSVPPIRVFERNGQWFSLDNRRLVAFQQAGVDVPYRLATPAEVAAEAWKVTTTNGGTSIRIRDGGGTWP